MPPRRRRMTDRQQDAFKKERRLLKEEPSWEVAKKLILECGMGMPHWLREYPLERIWRALQGEVEGYDRYG